MGAEWEDCVDLYEAEAARQILSDCRSEFKKKKKKGPAVYVVGVQPIQPIPSETESDVSVTQQVTKELSSQIILLLCVTRGPTSV